MEANYRNEELAVRTVKHGEVPYAGSPRRTTLQQRFRICRGSYMALSIAGHAEVTALESGLLFSWVLFNPGNIVNSSEERVKPNELRLL